jgi:hypothetical protein
MVGAFPLAEPQPITPQAGRRTQWGCWIAHTHSGGVPRLGVAVGRLDPALARHRCRFEFRRSSRSAETVPGDVIFAGAIRVVGRWLGFRHFLLAHFSKSGGNGETSNLLTPPGSRRLVQNDGRTDAARSQTRRRELCRRCRVDSALRGPRRVEQAYAP